MDNALITSASAVFQLLAAAAVGYVSATYPRSQPHLTPGALHSIARLSTQLTIPIMIVHTVGSTVNLAQVQRGGVLIIFSFISNTASFVAMRCWGYMLPDHLRVSGLWHVACIASFFANVSMPLVMLKR